MRVETLFWQAAAAQPARQPAPAPLPGAFDAALARARTADAPPAPPAPHTVRAGETLSGIVLRQLQASGSASGRSALYDAVQRVARANGLTNPDLIMPGQELDLSEISPATPIAQAAEPAEAAPAAASSPEPAEPSATGALPQTPLASLAPQRPAYRPAARPRPTTPPVMPAPAPAPVLPYQAPATRSSRAVVPYPPRLDSGLGGPPGIARARTPFQLTANFSLASPEEVAKAATALPSTGGSPWGRLVEGSARLTSEFGHRTDPFTGRPDYHRGIDLAADFGARIRPYAPGVVTFSGWQPGYGKLVIVRHDGGLETVYGHNASNLVRRGDSVDTETVIGLVGSTGRSTGPHLHFEVRENGESVDPVPYLSGGSFQVASR